MGFTALGEMLLMPFARPQMGFFHIPAKSDPESRAQVPASFLPPQNQNQVRAAPPVSWGERLQTPVETATKGPAHAEISSLPPHQHQGHAAAFAPQIRRNPFFSWVQMLIAGWQGKSPSHSPLLGQGLQGKAQQPKPWLQLSVG